MDRSRRYEKRLRPRSDAVMLVPRFHRIDGCFARAAPPRIAALDCFSWAPPRPEIRSANFLVHRFDRNDALGRHMHSGFIRRMPSGSIVKGGLQLGAGAAAGGGGTAEEIAAGRESRTTRARAGGGACAVDFERPSDRLRSISFSNVTTLLSVSKPCAAARMMCGAESKLRVPVYGFDSRRFSSR